MESELQTRFEEIERQRAALERVALTLNDSQLHWRPTPDAWSIVQIVHHLVLSDESVGRARQPHAVPVESLPFRIVPRAWRRAMVMNALRRDRVLPLPSTDVEPLRETPLLELLSCWQSVRREMRQELSAMKCSETRHFHPILGRLSAMQMLELSETHTAYHTRQIESLQRNATFPRGGREDS